MYFGFRVGGVDVDNVGYVLNLFVLVCVVGCFVCGVVFVCVGIGCLVVGFGCDCLGLVVCVVGGFCCCVG